MSHIIRAMAFNALLLCMFVLWTVLTYGISGSYHFIYSYKFAGEGWMYFKPFFERVSDGGPLLGPVFLWQYCLVSPLVEEVVFRGPVLLLIFSGFYKKIPRKAALSVLAISILVLNSLWASNHNLFMPVFIAGLAAYWLILKTGSIWPSVIFHSLCNLSLYVIVQAAVLLKLI